MRLTASVLCVGLLSAAAGAAESPVTVTIGSQPSATAIPADFLGLSFGMKTLPPNQAGAHFFSPTNIPLVTLFQNIGIKHLRMGGTTVESPPNLPIPNEADIDSLFAFVRTAGVQKVIYSLRLLETNRASRYDLADAAIARYIWDRHRDRLDCFSLGNEPDLQRVYHQDVSITNFATYLAKWRRFAAAITNAAPGAKFAGPDGGSGNVSWTTQFAGAEKDSGLLRMVTEHFYVGGAGRGVFPSEGITAMLSPAWVAANQTLHDRVAAAVAANGLPLRFTEANDHYSGGVRDASDTFAGALWALDFLHWWAAHNARGVNFHNTQWVVNDVITPDASGRLGVNPKGYGLKAFELGSRGSIEPLTILNSDGINLTAYAVRGPREHFVTLINKEHGSGARGANVSLAGFGSPASCDVICLLASNGEAAARTGVTLGGAALTADGPWQGEWNTLEAARSGQYAVKVPATSAAVVRIPAAKK